MKAAVLRRRAAINELHFVYKNLLRMLPSLVRRSPEAVAHVLQEQFVHVGAMLQRLTVVAHEHGQPPRSGLFAEAADRLDRLCHAERARSTKAVPGLATVIALQTLRIHLNREWGMLVHSLSGDNLPEFEAEAVEMQRQEIVLYHELVDLRTRLREAHGASQPEGAHNLGVPPGGSVRKQRTKPSAHMNPRTGPGSLSQNTT